MQSVPSVNLSAAGTRAGNQSSLCL